MSPDSPQQTLLILGASGDLTARLLLPGLGGLLAVDEVNDLSLVGTGIDDWDDDRWRAQVADSFAAASASGIEVDAVAQRSRYLQADVTSEDDLRSLLDMLETGAGALLVVEEAKAAQFVTPEGYEELERRAYDDTEFVFLKRP